MLDLELDFQAARHGVAEQRIYIHGAYEMVGGHVCLTGPCSTIAEFEKEIVSLQTQLRNLREKGIKNFESIGISN